MKCISHLKTFNAYSNPDSLLPNHKLCTTDSFIKLV